MDSSTTPPPSVSASVNASPSGTEPAPMVGATTVNWVTAGYSTAIKNQGACGEPLLHQIDDRINTCHPTLLKIKPVLPFPTGRVLLGFRRHRSHRVNVPHQGGSADALPLKVHVVCALNRLHAPSSYPSPVNHWDSLHSLPFKVGACMHTHSTCHLSSYTVRWPECESLHGALMSKSIHPPALPHIDRRDLPDRHLGTVAAAPHQLLHLFNRLLLFRLQWRCQR